MVIESTMIYILAGTYAQHYYFDYKLIDFAYNQFPMATRIYS